MPGIARTAVTEGIMIDKVKRVQNDSTVMTLSFRTDKSGQTVQTQIRLLLEEQSDQGLHCLLFHLRFLTKYPKVCPFCMNFR